MRTLADVERLRVPDPEEAFAPVLEAVRLVRAALRPDQAVVGFCGGPFTVAGYLVEGKPSREFALTKSLMLGEPDVWHALLEKLSGDLRRYVAAKARAGADVIQLFDSWVGALSPGALPRVCWAITASIFVCCSGVRLRLANETAQAIFPCLFPTCFAQSPCSPANIVPVTKSPAATNAMSLVIMGT